MALEGEYTVAAGTIGQITGWQARDTQGRRWSIVWQPGTGLVRALHPAGPVVFTLTAINGEEACEAARLLAWSIRTGDAQRELALTSTHPVHDI